MSKKYIKQINNDNFVFPNNTLAEYDAEIIHDLKENSVNGVITGFSPLTYSGTPANIGVSFTYQWYLNNAEPFISNDGKLNILSVHMQSPDKNYYKPWICVGQVQDNNVNLTYKTDTFLVWVTPQMMGQTSFSTGTYYFEIRFLGHRAVFPVSVTAPLAIPTPTPTPTGTGPTPTPTPSNPCYCYPIVVTGTTSGEGTIASLTYNDCYGVQTVRAFTVGPGTYYQCIQTISSVVQYDPGATTGIDQSYLTLTYQTGNCRTGYVCSGYDPAGPTPTPTPTATGVPPTATPTPTPTATSVGPTATPTPTPTATSVGPTATPTPTPTATSVGPTATPTPTPTATPPTEFYINIANNTTGSDITNILVNGIAITGASFPIIPGDGASGVSNQLGASYSVTVNYTSGTKYVEITDTDSNYNCANGTGAGRTFAGQVTNGTAGIMYITMDDGGCP